MKNITYKISHISGVPFVQILSRLSLIRYFSSNVYEPYLYYSNVDHSKLDILKDNKGKSSIYMWTNLMNNKSYIGSSVDLNRRFLEYFNINRLLRCSSMAINKALLKYGYSQFSLSILEYCEVYELMIKEKYSLNLLSPKYNILKEPGSPFRGSGWKQSKVTKAKMKIIPKSKETIAKFSMGQQTKQQVKVIKLNTKTVYHAVRAAAKVLGIDKRYIENYINLNQIEPVLGRYTLKK
jgi:GIY-YIG catalytic domain/NUMOD1 domain